MSESTSEKRRIQTDANGYISLVRSFLKWLLIALAVGAAVGLAGVAFHHALSFATEFRTENRVIIFTLPVAGVLIVTIYKLLGMSNDPGTNCIIKGARGEEKVSLRLAPLIFAATFLTHLSGGSAGREGAALQMGGSLASPVSRVLKLDKQDTATLIMCGMAAGFSALFGTPVAAAVFAVEVVIVAAAQYAALVPCMISGITASVVARIFEVAPESFSVQGIPALDGGSCLNLLRTAVLGIGCAAVSVLFCVTIKATGKTFEKYFKNDYVQILVGSGIIILLTVLLGTTDYNGAGMDVIERAFEGEAVPYAFLLKILFTALTLGAGFKGGEIVPCLFTGATFGCFVGGLLGLDPSFGAAIGMMAVFCGVTNCPFATVILSIELFGAEGLPYYALAIAISYMLSGYWGLYSAQQFYQSKIRPVKYTQASESKTEIKQ